MIARILSWMQEHTPFIHNDEYPDFEQEFNKRRIDMQMSLSQMNQSADAVIHDTVVRNNQVESIYLRNRLGSRGDTGGE